MLVVGKGITETEISGLAEKIKMLKVESISEAQITQLKFVVSTIVTYTVQVFVEVSIISSQISTNNPAEFVEEKNAETLTTFTGLKTSFQSFETCLTSAKDSTKPDGTKSAMSFTESSIELMILISKGGGFSAIALEVTTGITSIGNDCENTTPLSPKLIILIESISSSITIYIEIIIIQINIIAIEIGQTTIGPMETTGPGETTEGPGRDNRRTWQNNRWTGRDNRKARRNNRRTRRDNRRNQKNNRKDNRRTRRDNKRTRKDNRRTRWYNKRARRDNKYVFK